jgi:hypothetical protein
LIIHLDSQTIIIEIISYDNQTFFCGVFCASTTVAFPTPFVGDNMVVFAARLLKLPQQRRHVAQRVNAGKDATTKTKSPRERATEHRLNVHP